MVRLNCLSIPIYIILSVNCMAKADEIVNSPERRSLVNHPDKIVAGFDPGTAFVTDMYHGLWFVDFRRGVTELLASFPEQEDLLQAIATAEKSQLVFLGTATGEVIVYDFAKRKVVARQQLLPNFTIDSLHSNLAGDRFIIYSGNNVRISCFQIEKLKATKIGEVKTSVCELAFTPGLDAVVVGGREVSVYGVNAAGTLVLARSVDAPSPCESIAVSAEKDLIAAGYQNGEIASYRLSDLKPVRVIKAHAKEVICLSFVSQGEKLVSTSMDTGFRIWQVETGALHREIKGHSDLVSSLDAKGSEIFSRSRDFTIRNWNADREIADDDEKLPARMRQLEMSPSGRTIATHSEDFAVRFWDVETRKLINKVRLDDAGRNLPEVTGSNIAWIGDDQVACLFRGKLEIVESQAGVICEGDFGKEMVTAFAPHPNDPRLAVATTDRKLSFWNVGSGETKLLAQDFPKEIVFITIFPDGSKILVGLEFGKCLILDTKTGAQLCQFESDGECIYDARFFDEGRKIALALGYHDGGGGLEIWDVANNKSPKVASRYQSELECFCCDVSDDERQLAFSGQDAHIHIYDLAANKIVKHIDSGHNSFVSCLRYKGVDSVLVGGWDTTLRIISIKE